MRRGRRRMTISRDSTEVLSLANLAATKYSGEMVG